MVVCAGPVGLLVPIDRDVARGIVLESGHICTLRTLDDGTSELVIGRVPLNAGVSL